MKHLFFAACLLFSLTSFAQKDCEYAQNTTDSLGVYKATKDYVMHERIFGSNARYLFFTLINSDGVPMLGLQYIQKSSEFIKSNCLDKNSKMFLQLDNGKVITLLHTPDEQCSAMVSVPGETRNVRLLSGNFLFLKGTIDDLKASPVNLVRLKLGLETLDFALKSKLRSELMEADYEPQTFLMKYYKCVE